MPSPFMKKKTFKTRHAGELRQSQLITTFGVGSIVDFVRDTIIIAGVDDWEEDEELQIFNENLQSLTGAKYFLNPKTNTENMAFYKKTQDIPSYIFPEKLYCTSCSRIFDVKELETRDKVHTCFACKSKKPLVAARFVVVCENGHMEDFPYSWWVHKGGKCSSGHSNPRIKMFNVGGRSSIDSLMLQCEDCENIRPMQSAFSEFAFAGENGYRCSGKYPHLKNPEHFNDKMCDATFKTRLRASSSIYFPVIKSALSIPPWSKTAEKEILKKYEHMSYIDESRIADYLKNIVSPPITSIVTLEDLITAYRETKKYKDSDISASEKSIFYDEYKALCKPSESEEFSSSFVTVPSKYKNYFEGVVILDKLTEVQALCGFTRLSPWSGKENDDKIGPLSMYKKDWFPAIKNIGEGIFFKFDEKCMAEWILHVNGRYDKMNDRLEESFFFNSRFSPQYILLHTFAHAFIRQVSNECGYSAASIKEKIYSTFYDDDENNPYMCGVLIYLTTSDSDGSLGGLISVAQNESFFSKVLDNMLVKALWCSADPLCINTTEQGFLSLNYSACHDCMLLPETSCEFRNILLDRVSLVGKIENRHLGYFFEAL